MNNSAGRRSKRRGSFPCSECSISFSNRRNRRRHTQLRHNSSYPLAGTYPPSSNHSTSSGPQRCSKSRSAEAAALLEQAKAAVQEATYPLTLASLQDKFPGVPQKSLLELLQNPKSDERSKIEPCKSQLHHESLHAKKVLCKCKPCTEATAQGRRNLPQRLLVRARVRKVSLLFCPFCDENMKSSNHLRAHCLSFHTSKSMQRRLDTRYLIPLSEDEYWEEDEEEEIEIVREGVIEIEKEEEIEEEAESDTDRVDDASRTPACCPVESDQGGDTEDEECTRL